MVCSEGLPATRLVAQTLGWFINFLVVLLEVDQAACMKEILINYNEIKVD